MLHPLPQQPLTPSPPFNRLPQIQSDHYEDFFLPALQKHGYTAVYKKKTAEAREPAAENAEPRPPPQFCPVCLLRSLSSGRPTLHRANPPPRPGSSAPSRAQVYVGNAYAIDGCAIFFKKSRFNLIKKYEARPRRPPRPLLEAPGSRSAACGCFLRSLPPDRV